MPITKSAKKSLRTSINKFRQNDKIRRQIDIDLKSVNADNASAMISKIDKAAKQNIIHPNKAARLKSKIAKSIKGNLVKRSMPKSTSTTTKKIKKTTPAKKTSTATKSKTKAKK